MDIVKERIQLNFRGMDEDGRMPACPAGEHRGAQSHAHLLILTEMLLTREL